VQEELFLLRERHKEEYAAVKEYLLSTWEEWLEHWSQP